MSDDLKSDWLKVAAENYESAIKAETYEAANLRMRYAEFCLGMANHYGQFGPHPPLKFPTPGSP